MTRLIDAGRTAFRQMLERVGRGWSKMQERRPLSYDHLESEDAYLVVFDAPGVRGEDVQVKFLDHTIEVRLDRYRDFYEGFEMMFPGRGLTLSGSADLPRDADVTPHGASATLTRNGTLEVEIPKDESAKRVDVVEENDGVDEDRGDDDGVDEDRGDDDGVDEDRGDDDGVVDGIAKRREGDGDVTDEKAIDGVGDVTDGDGDGAVTDDDGR